MHSNLKPIVKNAKISLMKKTEKEQYIQISKYKIVETCRAYFRWKELDSYIRSVSYRGINMPDAISEPMACYCLGLLWNSGTTKGDATDFLFKKVIEFKATSRFEGDLSSFGPDCYFDDLFLLRFNLTDDLLYIYDLRIDSKGLATIKVNSAQTVGDQQKQGRRPHLSLIELLVKPQHIDPLVVFDIENCRIIEDNR